MAAPDQPLHYPSVISLSAACICFRVFLFVETSPQYFLYNGIVLCLATVPLEAATESMLAGYIAGCCYVLFYYVQRCFIAGLWL